MAEALEGDAGVDAVDVAVDGGDEGGLGVGVEGGGVGGEEEDGVAAVGGDEAGVVEGDAVAGAARASKKVGEDERGSLGATRVRRGRGARRGVGGGVRRRW
ncbi:MAG: hypothetical protein R3F65_00900 [bacterium]